MVNLNTAELCIDHAVIFAPEHKVFAAAREQGKRRILIFIINEISKEAFIYDGAKNAWFKLADETGSFIVARICSACRDNSIPVYRLEKTSSEECCY